MKTKWNFLMVLVLLATLLGGNAGAAEAQGEVSGISPVEGTMGTQVTITGAAFGDKHGEVLLGEEKCKVLDWNDTAITFLVDKPQPAGSYPVTVLLQGDKKPAELLMSSSFTMRRPKINPGELAREGNEVIVAGDFFGDKKGGVRIAYFNGAVVIDNPKILDWSMNTIRFELPEGLAGTFFLGVRNEVGAGLAVLDLVNNLPPLLGSAPGFKGGEAENNSSGVFFLGKFYVFSIHETQYMWETQTIEVRTFKSGELSAFLPIAKGETYAQIVPLVVENQLFVFHTAKDSRVLYTKCVYNSATGICMWDTQWHQVLTFTTDSNNYEIAAVYNPTTHRISSYHTKGGTVVWGYSDDYGQTWTNGGNIVDQSNATNIESKAATSAVYYQGDVNGTIYDTLLTSKNNAGQIVVYAIKNAAAVIIHTVDGLVYERAYLMDDLGSSFIALIYTTAHLAPPIVIKMDKTTGVWGSPYNPVSDWATSWSINGAVNYIDTGSGYVRKFYLFWGSGEFDTIDPEFYIPPSWTMTSIQDLGSGTPYIPLGHSYVQVSAGEVHTCVITSGDEVGCWGNNNNGQLNSPNGTFSQISAGDLHTCGVRPDRTIECWGWDASGQVSNHPTDANYTQVTVGKWHSCALRTDGRVICWGDDSGTGRMVPLPGMLFKQITAAAWHTCGILKDNGHVICWGDDGGTGRAKPPTDRAFEQISAASWHTCGVVTDKTISCWGNNDASRVDPIPDGTFTQVTTGNWHTCGIKTDGTIACWGSDDDTRVSSRPTTGVFTQIDAGLRNTCAMRNDAHTVCWGNDSAGQSTPPH